MSSDTAQLIKEKLDIVDFLRPYVQLKPAGKNMKACCPFHKEKTPSFMVSPERQSWHCFGACNEGGDIIKFLMKYENLEFYDALKVLAEKAGVDIKTSGNRDFKSYNSLYAVMEAAKNFFRSNLVKSDLVRNYLRERGLKDETVQEFEIGFAADGSDILTHHLLKLGYNILDIEKAGLAIKTERGTYWDRFRGRIMFPIYNHFGKVVAFTGRILPGNNNPNVGKYVNSPETPVFQKSKILYGFHRTKSDIREAKTAVLVEGQMDFLMVWQDGIKNAVATSGTALTQDHLAVLRRLADEVVLSFDADLAGQIAAERSIDLAGAHDFAVKLLVIEDAKFKDPADVVREQPGKIKDLLGGAKSAMDYYFYKYFNNASTDIKAKKQNLRVVLAKIKNLSSPIERSHWLNQLSKIARIDERVLAEEMEILTPAGVAEAIVPAGAPAVSVSQKLSRRELISQRLLGVMLHLQNDMQTIEDHLKYFPEQYLTIYRDLLLNKGVNVSSDLGDFMNSISLRFSFENQDFDVENLKKEMRNLLRELRVEYLKDKRQEISDLIKILEGEGDENKLQAAMREFANISKELHNA
ncbi:MAG: DNA primase [Candidatus Harrisonbacteria bacterium]|nr:DNA primase [Candidatus Harrisonbacteria bacterium]